MVDALLEARLREPLAIRDVCAALAAVNPSGNLLVERSKLVLSACNSLQTFQLWVELANDSVLDHVSSLESFAIEIHFESFHRMFRSFNPMCEVFMRISERGSMQRVVALRMKSDAAEGPEMVVRQRINALAKPLTDVPSETLIGDLDMCCELALGQLAQVVRVADKYRQLDAKLECHLTSDHQLTIMCHPSGVQINTSWAVAFPEVLPGSQASQRSHLSQQAHDKVSVCVQSRDWHIAMVHCQQLARRVVLGLVQNQVLAVYCYPHADNDDNVLTFYLSVTI